MFLLLFLYFCAVNGIFYSFTRNTIRAFLKNYERKTKNIIMKNQYTAPEMEVLDLTVEQGFANSLPDAGDFEGTTPETGN